MKRKDLSLNMNRFFMVAGIIALYSLVILNTVSGGPPDVVNLCCFSTDPSNYGPKCYTCEAGVYRNALAACLNRTEMPQNISFKAAYCMEKNCELQLPKMAEPETMNFNPLLELIKSFLETRTKRSVLDNNVDGSDLRKDVHIIKEVTTIVLNEEKEVKFMDPEYIG